MNWTEYILPIIAALLILAITFYEAITGKKLTNVRQILNQIGEIAESDKNNSLQYPKVSSNFLDGLAKIHEITTDVQTKVTKLLLCLDVIETFVSMNKEAISGEYRTLILKILTYLRKSERLLLSVSDVLEVVVFAVTETANSDESN